jgi:hypothetical protein
MLIAFDDAILEFVDTFIIEVTLSWPVLLLKPSSRSLCLGRTRRSVKADGGCRTICDKTGV